MAGRVIRLLARGGIALLAGTYLAGAALAQEVRARQDIEYRLIAAQPVETGERIEVIDFFWYGCPYCNELQPALEDWIRRKPSDVALRRIPAVLRDSWAPHARIYYTLEALGEVERLHLKVYDGYHVEELQMSRSEVMEQWAVRNGIGRRRWFDAYHSPEVEAKVARARELAQRYEVRGTPSMVVDGRYLTSSSMATVRGVVPVVEDLIVLARRKRSEK